MSIQGEVQRLQSAKSSLADAITAKGVTVPEGTKLDGYAALVGQIQTGGGGGGTDLETYLFDLIVANGTEYTVEPMNSIVHPFSDVPKTVGVAFFPTSFPEDRMVLVTHQSRTLSGYNSEENFDLGQIHITQTECAYTSWVSIEQKIYIYQIA